MKQREIKAKKNQPFKKWIDLTKKRGNETNKEKKMDNEMKKKNIKQNERKQNKKNRNDDNLVMGWFFKILTSDNKIFVNSLILNEFSNEKSLDYTRE